MNAQYVDIDNTGTAGHDAAPGQENPLPAKNREQTVQPPFGPAEYRRRSWGTSLRSRALQKQHDHRGTML